MNVRSVVRAIPPIARRDATIAELKDKVRRLLQQRDQARAATEKARRSEESARIAADRSHQSTEAARAEAARRRAQGAEEPSWLYKRAESLRLRAALRELGRREPIWTVNDKVAGYRFAHSHGLDVPRVLATYDSIRDISWDDLPDGFVIKAVGGAASHGVMPIERSGDQVVDLLDTRRGTLGIDEVVAYFEEQVDRGKCTKKGVIEELLRSPYPDAGGVAPDIKLYCFHGVVGMIMMRDVDGSRRSKHFRTRFFDVDGSDLGQVIVGRPVDPAVPPPRDLKGVVDIGERLSRALPAPFARIDLYERPDSIVFGEITPHPGGNQTLAPDLDREFGRLWEEAEARLRAETLATGTVSVAFGEVTPADRVV